MKSKGDNEFLVLPSLLAKGIEPNRRNLIHEKITGINVLSIDRVRCGAVAGHFANGNRGHAWQRQAGCPWRLVPRGRASGQGSLQQYLDRDEGLLDCR